MPRLKPETTAEIRDTQDIMLEHTMPPGLSDTVNKQTVQSVEEIIESLREASLEIDHTDPQVEQALQQTREALG